MFFARTLLNLIESWKSSLKGVVMDDGFGKLNPRNMPRHFFRRAVHLDCASAVRADISKQNYSICPRYSYIDATFRCTQCEQEFLFSIDDQRFWYEELRFWVDSLPTQCASCRKTLRRLNNLQQEYDRNIKHALLRNADIAEKRRIIEAIEGLESGGVSLPARTHENLRVLRGQVARSVS